MGTAPENSPAPSAYELSETSPAAESRFRRWVLEHDNSWWFVGWYVGLAVVLSLVISLFWLVAVVAVHGLIELLRQRWLTPQPAGPLGLRVAWELKLDLALILFALALAGYMEVVLGVAGIGGAARLGVQAGARAGVRATGWSRGLRGVLLSLDDAAQLGRAVAGKGGGENEEYSPRDVMTRPWRARWKWSDHLAVWGGAFFLLLLLAAPWLTHHDYSSLLAVLAGEMHPFP